MTQGPPPADPSPSRNKTESTLVEKSVKPLHVLELVSAGRARVKVSADGNLPQDFTLRAEERVSIRAIREFNILVENKCAVALFFDGKPVTIPGRCGDPVNLSIP